MRPFLRGDILFSALLLSLIPAVSPAQPSVVTVNGAQLMVAERQGDGTLAPAAPYVLKGIAWNAATRAPAAGRDPFNSGQITPYGFFIGRADLLTYWTQQETVVRYATDFQIMAQMNANTLRMYFDLSDDPGAVQQILDTLYSRGMMIIVTVATGKADIDNNHYLEVVQMYKDHPAVLMWLFGNEWNYSSFNGYASWDDAIAAINPAIANVKAADPNHPVSSSLGNDFSAFSYIVPRMPGVDIWDLVVYWGSSFGTFFSQWKALTNKPFYFGEFGTDSFRTTAYTQPFADNRAQVQAGSEDPMKQASFDAGLWKEIHANLSATNPAFTCVGGTVFSFNDNIWKIGNYSVNLGGLVNYNGPDGISKTADDDHSYDSYNPDGFAIPGSHPDNIANEEYFGLVTADRVKKLAFGALKHYFSGAAPQINAGQDRTVAVSAPAFLNGALVDDGLPFSLISSTWSKPSYSGSGSGNVTFANKNALQTTAVFLDIGTYVLKLTADDGILQGTSDVTFQVVTAVPVVIDGITASPNPVTGAQTTLAVASRGGTAPYSYTWTQPPNATLNVTAPSPTVTFAKAGSYAFTLILQDALGASVDQSITVPVNQTASTVVVTPPASSLEMNQTYTFSASVKDQFGDPLSVQPPVTWSVSPAGASIDSSGQFVATSPGPYTVQATASGLVGTAVVSARAVLPIHVRTLYSDKGVMSDAVVCNSGPVCAWSGAAAIFDGQSTDLATRPEGKASYKSSCSSWVGWGIYLAAGSRNLSAFNNGQLRFWVYTNNSNMKVEMKNSSQINVLNVPLGSRITALNQWIPIAINLSGVALGDVFIPFAITANSGATFYVDNVRLVDSTVSPVFNVGIYNISDNLPASQILFSGAEAGGGWTLADQYVQLEVDSTFPSWGVQIYTDNTAADAVPQYTGPSSMNPAGLLDSVAKDQSMPMAWNIKPNSAEPPVPVDPDDRADVDSFQWLFMKDAATPDIPQANTTRFINGEYFVTTVSNKGIQFASGPNDSGAENPPNQIYFEANFLGAYTPRTYQTNTLRLEIYLP